MPAGAVVVVVDKESSMLWHRRLGHISLYFFLILSKSSPPITITSHSSHSSDYIITLGYSFMYFTVRKQWRFTFFENLLGSLLHLKQNMLGDWFEDEKN